MRTNRTIQRNWMIKLLYIYLLKLVHRKKKKRYVKSTYIILSRKQPEVRRSLDTLYTEQCQIIYIRVESTAAEALSSKPQRFFLFIFSLSLWLYITLLDSSAPFLSGILPQHCCLTYLLEWLFDRIYMYRCALYICGNRHFIYSSPSAVTKAGLNHHTSFIFVSEFIRLWYTYKRERIYTLSFGFFVCVLQTIYVSNPNTLRKYIICEHVVKWVIKIPRAMFLTYSSLYSILMMIALIKLQKQKLFTLTTYSLSSSWWIIQMIDTMSI